MGYSARDSVVRLDRFKASGKWYDSRELDMSDFYVYPLIHEAVAESMLRAGINLEEGWRAVVLEPFHRDAHPVMISHDYYSDYCTRRSGDGGE